MAGLKDNLNQIRPHIMHFAGHSGYDPEQAATPHAGGLLMHDGNYFTGEHILALDWTPRVVVFNSCESARILRRRGSVPLGEDDVGDTRSTSLQRAATGAISVAEAFFNAGVEHYIGTFWPVQDAAATAFADVLYSRLTQAESIGDAIRHARNGLFNDRRPDWANYIHYGDPEAILLPKTPKT